MTFSNLCNEIFWKSTTDYHVTDSVDAPMNNPYELKTIEYLSLIHISEPTRP